MKNLNLYFIVFIASLLLSYCSTDKEDIIEPEIPTSTAILSLKTTDGSDLNFGEIVKTKTKTLEVNIQNDGNSTLEISKIKFPNGFSSDWTSSKIAKKSFKLLKITFSPSQEIKYSGIITITSNATNKPKKTNITGIGINETYNGDILLKTQEELNEFVEKGFTSVSGTLCLGSCGPNFDPTNITSLIPLKEIKSVDRLKVYNTSLVNLEGIKNIKIDNGIEIGLNNSLSSLKGFPIKKRISVLSIVQNKVLTNIDALSHLESILYKLQIVGNENLLNLNGLSNLNTIDYDLSINNNPKIINLDPLSNLKIVKNLSISHNFKLNSFCGIKSLLSSGGLKGRFGLMKYNKYNPTKHEIINGYCQKNIPDNVYHGEMRISSKAGLDFFIEKEYEIIEGRLIIQDIKKINDLTGLEKLKKITKDFAILNNSITSLKGLGNLKKTGSFSIRENKQLSNFCTIEALAKIPNGVLQFNTKGNLYNPTLDNLKSGNCSQ